MDDEQRAERHATPRDYTALIMIAVLGACEVAILYVLIAVETPLKPLVSRLLENPAGVFTIVMIVVTILCFGMAGVLTLHERRGRRWRSGPDAMLAIAAAGTLVASLATPLCAQQSAPSWPQHSLERPKPQIQTAPKQQLPVPAPVGALVLFDGRDLRWWEKGNGEPAGWRLVPGGAMEVVSGAGDIRSTAAFGDVMLHIEWATPSEAKGTGQEPGNSGVYLMERYEVQVLDSYGNLTYADGQAGAIYGQFPPRVNVSRPPGAWQSFDIEFRRPQFDPAGVLVRPARMTVRQNGVVIHDDVALLGPTWHRSQPPYTAHADALPIMLQDHGDPVRFRNIWVRPLAP